MEKMQADVQYFRELLGQDTVALYHGNKDMNMVPTYGRGKETNDYGQGFYMTPDKEMACEWAWSGYTKKNDAWLHAYKLNLSELNIFDFTMRNPIEWLAEIAYNRGVNIDNDDVALQDNINILIQKCKVDMSDYDIIMGCRADDRYYRYVQAFFGGKIYEEAIEQAMRCGELGLQVCIKSERAFDALRLAESPVSITDKYRDRYDKHMTEAMAHYKAISRARSGHRGRSFADIIRDVESKR